MDSAPPNRSPLVAQATAGARCPRQRLRVIICSIFLVQDPLMRMAGARCPCSSKGKTVRMEKNNYASPRTYAVNFSNLITSSTLVNASDTLKSVLILTSRISRAAVS